MPDIQLIDICKRYGNIIALDHVSMKIHSNKITAVVGDNGAGKTTLIKILAGAIRPDSGVIAVDEEKFYYLTPASAIKWGIATVYQDLALVNTRDIPLFD